jgi:hypothetical protein
VPDRAVFSDMELAFRTKARFFVPPALTDPLQPMADAATLAVLVDVDALVKRSQLDRVMLLALQALARTQVHVMLVSHDEQIRLGLWRRGVPLTWLSADVPRRAMTHLRSRDRGVRVVAITDCADNVDAEHDCWLDLRRTSVAEARAALWWLVHARS